MGLEFDPWDGMRLANTTLATIALILMATRYRHWLSLTEARRFHWLSTVAFTASITYANIEQLIADVPGGPRIAVQTVALGWLYLALYYATRNCPPTKETTMSEPYDPRDADATELDTTPAEDTKPPTSPKVIAGALTSLAAGVVLALLLALATPEGATQAGLPPLLQFVLVTILPPLASFLGGFVKTNSEAYLAPALRAARRR